MIKVEELKDWKDGINQVICGDSLKLMKLMPDKCVDLVLTDPPYGVDMNYLDYKDTEENWFLLLDKVIPELRRIATMVIMPSCQIKRLDWFYKNHKPDWVMCWYKGSVGCAGYTGFNDWEPHLVWGKNTNTMHDYFKATPEPQINGHPCQKPLSWANWIIGRATKDKQMVFDPFMGSWTTARACKDLGRNFIGCELSEKYCEIGESRLRQGNLF